MSETNRPQITTKLSDLFEEYIDPHNDPRIYWAKEVTFDYATANTVRVDYMKFKPKNNTVSGIEHGDFYCYEIKSSVEDFRSKNGHNFLGDYNYYVMPKEVYETVEKEIPFAVGVMCPATVTGWSLAEKLQVVKLAKRKDRSRPCSEMLLMMWRSSRREVVNARRSKNKLSTSAKQETSCADNKQEEFCLVCRSSYSADGPDGEAVLVCFDKRGESGKTVVVPEDGWCPNYT